MRLRCFGPFGAAARLLLRTENNSFPPRLTPQKLQPFPGLSCLSKGYNHIPHPPCASCCRAHHHLLLRIPCEAGIAFATQSQHGADARRARSCAAAVGMSSASGASPARPAPKQIRFVNNEGQPPAKRRRINAAYVLVLFLIPIILYTVCVAPSDYAFEPFRAAARSTLPQSASRTGELAIT